MIASSGQNPLNSSTGSNSSVVGSKGTSIVRLNIGGSKFVTTEATLLSCGSSFFSSLLSGFPSLKDEEGAYFIDRDGASFAPILSYLRTGQLIVPPHIPREVLYHILRINDSRKIIFSIIYEFHVALTRSFRSFFRIRLCSGRPIFIQ